MTDRTAPSAGPFTQESPMSKTDRHDELVALLSKISEESVTASNVLADMLDLLRDRLPEYVNPALDWLDEPTPVPRPEPAPADDLSGEPVEPGDLRAGDKVAFTWKVYERITGSLVSGSGSDGDVLRSDTPDKDGYYPNVVVRGEWCHGISDVRLIERAPREDENRVQVRDEQPAAEPVDRERVGLRRDADREHWLTSTPEEREHAASERTAAPDVDPDEALAKVLWEIDDPEPTYGWDRARANGVYQRMARVAREHIEAERGER